MKKLSLLFIFFFVVGLVAEIFPQGNFGTSLHSTRNGKPHWYNTIANGGTDGYETLTGVPINTLGCVECHDAVDANGDPYPPTGYTPGCVDCHATNTTGWPVTQDDCLGCHSREKAIITMGLPDVHRTAGKVCMDCHQKEELHGDDGVNYSSMFQDGAITTDCSNAGCHQGFTHPGNQDPHGGKLHCTSCHAQTNLACYNCHFESQVQSHVKRAYKQITGFMMLVNRTKDNKVHPATFQSLSYQGNTWIAIGPSVAHTIVKSGARTCSDCHQNFGGSIPAIEDFNADGIINFATWNSSDSTLSYLQGIVPMPLDYMRSFKLDFITYNGPTSDPPGPSKNWSFVEDRPDGYQMLYATPLTTLQMSKLGMDTLLVNSINPIDNNIPKDFNLDQNYPNPFNPSTKIRYAIPQYSFVELSIYDALGNVIQKLVNENLEAGNYEINFNASGLSSGVYFYQIKAGNFSATKKLILMK